MRRVFWWFFLIVFVGSCMWAGAYLWQSANEGGALEALSAQVKLARPTPFSSSPTAPSGPVPREALGAPAQTPAPAATGDSLRPYRALAQSNADMVGWIFIEDTPVDYPVMHTPQEPQFYLHRNFEKKRSFAGLPFLDALCDPGADSVNQILYAHNMKTGQMFAALKRYLNEKFLAEHPLIHYDTLERTGAYRVMAVLELKAVGRSAPSMLCYQPIDTLEEASLEALDAYLDRYASVRVPGVSVSPGDGLITLSTCEEAGSAKRLVVMATELRQESIN